MALTKKPRRRIIIKIRVLCPVFQIFHSEINPGRCCFLKAQKHFILWIAILVGIMASVLVLSGRIEAEQSNRSYDIVLDYSSVKDMSERSEEDVAFWLRHFYELGVDKLGLPELTVKTLKDAYPSKIYFEPVDSILEQYRWEDAYPAEIQSLIQASEKDDVVVSCTDPELAEWVADAFARRCELPVATVAEDGTMYFHLTGNGGKARGTNLLDFPLGLDPAIRELALEIGYTVIPRSIPLKELNGSLYARDLLASFEELNAPYLICTGEQVPGLKDGDTAVKDILAHLEKTGTTLAVVETSQQSMNLVSEPLEALVRASGDNAVRAFTMWEYIQWRYQWYGYEGSEEIVNCLYRAVYERNCRIVYLKMMLRQLPDESTEYITDPGAYTELLTNFNSRMSGLGYTRQTIGSMGHLQVTTLLAIGVAIGAVAAAALLFDLVFPLKKKLLWLLTALGWAGAAAVLFVMPNTGRLVLSIGGGIVMPLLAMVLVSEKASKQPLAVRCVTTVAAATLISLIGGLFTSAALSDSSFMLEMELYRGVKVMQLIPLAGFVAWFLFAQYRDRLTGFLGTESAVRKQQVNAFLETPIRVKFVVYARAAALVGAIFLAVGSYYLARTGHTAGATTTDLEMMLRNLLEEKLPARPRTKEFLIGYPCVMLYVWCRNRNLKWLSIVPGLGAMIGLTSIVNTFLHIRTTFLLSLIRVGIGLGFGLVLGFAAVAAAEVLYRFIKKRIFHV